MPFPDYYGCLPSAATANTREHLPRRPEMSIVPRSLTAKILEPRRAEVIFHPSGRRMRRNVFSDGFRVGSSRSARTWPDFSFEVILNESGPKQVGAFFTSMTLPCSSQRFGVA